MSIASELSDSRARFRQNSEWQRSRYWRPAENLECSSGESRVLVVQLDQSARVIGEDHRSLAVYAV